MRKKKRPRSVRSLIQLRNALRSFATARNWEQFHSSKNLAIALSVEAAEVLEHFQWLVDQPPKAVGKALRRDIGEELADVLICLVMLADKLEIDVLGAASKKMAKNARKYPIRKAYGRNMKYSDL